jgi:pyruvate kinase
MRRTKIIATIGPKTESLEYIEKLARAGMNIARLNMSHGTQEWNSKVIENIKKVSKSSEFPIGLMIDTQGPEIRTSATEVGLEVGETFKIAVDSACDIQEGEKHTYVTSGNLVKKVKPGDVIMIDDGLIALEVRKVEPYHITCKVLNKGSLGKKKSINMPGIRKDMPALSQKDVGDIKFCSKLGIDFVAQSFVRKRSDVVEMKKHLKEAGSNAMIIAKIEDKEGVDNREEIIQEADGLMVARGDLGVELPIEEIPIVQKMLVNSCIKAGKPVIIATHLLESMIKNPRPTRAEVTDVANAVFEKADCIMLSGETTKGEYPEECVTIMSNIAKNVQKELKFDHGNGIKTNDVKEAITLGACINAENLDAKAIVVFSRTGRLLRMVTKRRPNTDIFVFTGDDGIKNKLMLYWGAFPFRLDFKQEFEVLVRKAIEKLKDSKLLVDGDRIIIVSDINPRKDIEILEIREV